MKKKLIYLSVIIILIGIIIVAVKGFNVNLKYKAHKAVNIPIDVEYNVEDIKTIANEVFEKEKVQIEKTGLYGDIVSINVQDVSDEQIENLANKINEKYNLKQNILIPVGEDYTVEDIEQIAKDVLKKDSVNVEKYADDETYVSIEANVISENTLEELVNKINEKYALQNETSSVSASKKITTTQYGRVALRDMAKQYINYVIISAVIILVYFAIRFRKLGVANVLAKTVMLLVLAELLYIAVLAIIRYPIDKLAIIAALAIYIIVVTYLNSSFLKQVGSEKESNK